MNKNRKYLIAIILIYFAVCALLFNSFYNLSVKSSIKRLNNVQRIYANQARIGLTAVFETYFRILKSLSLDHRIIDFNNRGKDILKYFYLSHKSILTSVVRTNSRGRILYALPYRKKMVFADISKQSHIKKVIRTKMPAVSDVFVSVQGFDMIAIHFPVMKNDVFTGTVGIGINFKKIAKSHLEVIKVGAKGYAWVISENGSVIYSPVPGITGRSAFKLFNGFPSVKKMVNEMLQGRSGACTYYYNRIKENKVAALKKHAVYMPIKIGDTFWSITVATPEKYVLSTLTGYRNKLLLILSMIFFGSSFLSYYAIRSVIIAREGKNRLKTELELIKSKERYEELFKNTGNCVAVFNITENGEDFVFVDINSSAEKTDKLLKSDIIGKTLTEVLPSIKDCCLFNIFKDVYQTGKSSKNNVLFYKDSRIEGWRKCDVYKLSGGEIVSVYDDITEKKNADDELKLNKQRMELIIRGADLGTWEWEIKTGEVIFNSRWAQMLGYNPDEIKPHVSSWSNLLHPDDKEKSMKTLNRHLEGKTDFYEIEHRLKSKSGEWVWVLSKGQVIQRDQSGRPVKACGTHLDISERKRIEEALEKRIISLTRPLNETETITFDELFDIDEIQKLQDIFSSAAGVASLITDTKGIPITKPSNFTRLCKDIIRNTDKGLLNCCKSDAAIGRLNAAGPIVSECLGVGLWDAGTSITVGGKRIANWLIGQVRDESQTEEKVIEYAKMIGVNEDEVLSAYREVPFMPVEKFNLIAQTLFVFAGQLSKIAYQNVQQARFISELKSAEGALVRSEDKYKNYINNSPTGIFILDNLGKLTEINQSLCDLLGFSKEELYNSFISSFVCKGEIKNIESILSLNTDDKINKDVQFSRKDGNEITLRINAVRLDENKTIGFCLDISMLINALDDAKMANLYKTEFLANMSHEIRTPLTIILGYNQFMMTDKNLTSLQKENMKLIDKSGKRLMNLLMDILTISQIEANKTSIVKENINLLKLFNEISELNALALKEQNTKFSYDLSSIKEIYTDQKRLGQILINLIGNAIKFTKNGNVDVKLHEEQNKYIFCVRDNGIGISKEYQKNIFESFFVGEVGLTKQYSGTGLGLAICKRLTQLLGGKIWVESAPGKGSTFCFSISKENNNGEREKADNNKMNENTEIKRSLKIIAVDDEEMILRFIHEIIAFKTNHKIDTYSSSKSFIYELKEKDADLILLDIRMPELSGAECLKEIRNIKSGIPVIALTAFAMENDKDKYIAMGFNDYISKPVDIDDFISKINRYAV
jgi:PAS domain S-box-containing protein